MPTDPWSNSRYPAASAAPNAPQDMQNAVTDLGTKVVPRFATTGARDTAAANTTLVNGMSCWCDSPGAYFDRINGAWVQRNAYTGVLKFVQYSDPNPVLLTTTNAALTIYSLPAFTVAANRRLRLIHTVTTDSQTANSAYLFQIRVNGAVSRQSVANMPFIGVAATFSFVHEIEPSAGSLTITMNGQLLAGTGTPRLLCDAAMGPTSFYVEDIGSTV